MVQAWSIAGRYKNKVKSLNPGPGQYSSRNIHSRINKSPQWTIGTAKRGELTRVRAEILLHYFIEIFKVE